MDPNLRKEILDLKKSREALILAHYYEESEIQDLADFVGDSLQLSQVGESAKNPIVLLAGVYFMAESVKILSPNKKVLIPDTNAGCSLVDHSPYDKYLAWRQKYPNGIAVTYVNSSAAVKSISDVICTSSNAEKIINAIPADRPILFGPDRHLGNYLSKKLNRSMHLWPGSCEVHVLFSARKLHEMKLAHPDARVLAHPECPEEVLQYADVIGSTTRLLDEVKNNPSKKYIVATEIGIFHQMQKSRPDATLIQAPAEGSCACNQCPYMKLSTPLKIRDALLNLKPEVHVNSDIAEKAKTPLRRMLEITAGHSVSWPDYFSF